MFPVALNQRRALVVGAASGMGATIGARLQKKGYGVVGADLPGQPWPLEAPEHRVPLDLSRRQSVSDGVAQATEMLGGLDVVVNCAGILGGVRPSHTVPMDEFERVLLVNLTGAFALSQAVIPILLNSESGRLIHFSSLAGKVGNPEMAAYSASKAGLIGLVKSLGKEYAGTSLTINAVAPAAMDTPMIKEIPEIRRAKQLALIPLGRFGTTDEAAALVEYVASQEAAFTTGFVFDLSGGRADY